MRSLPSHWSRGRIKWDTVTVAGATPSTDDDGFWLEGDDPDGTPFVAIADMSRRDRVTSTSKSLSAVGLASRKTPIGQPGTLLLAMYASVGELAFLDIEATWNQALLGITPDSEKLDARFLRYALLDMRDDLLREVRSNTQANLNARQVGDTWYAKAPLEEQRAIADFLDRETARIDTLIAEQQRLIEMLKERRLLNVAHAIPKDGPKGRMKWDTRMVAGGTPDTNVDEYWLDGDDENGIPFVAIGDMSRRRSVTSTVKRLSESAMTSRTMPTGQPGTLLLAMYASVGEVALLEIEATWNQAILGITPDPTKLDANFLRYALLQMRSDLLRDVRSNTQANLNASQVGDLWVPMPSLNEQRRIAAHLDNQMEKIDTTLAETERFVELSRERRSALITAAVTGQINVREVA